MLRTIKYCVKCNKFAKFVNPKITYIFEKTLVFSIICSEWGNNIKIIFKEVESIEIFSVKLSV